jgi:DedD protein
MSAENGMPDNEDVKKKALLRLAVAGVVTAAALGGLWWLDKGGGETKKAKPETSAPAPIVTAPPNETPAPATEAPATAPPTSAAETPADHPAIAPETTANEVAPPPPRVNNTPKPPAPSPAPTHTPVAPPVAKVAPAPQPPAALPPPPPIQPSGKGYIVQLGVFSNPDNARELVEKLNKQGVRAHLEARVQIGPFLNRQEAEKAQTEMRKLGYNALVTLPYSAAAATK